MICKTLELDWEEIAGLKGSESEPTQSEHPKPSDIMGSKFARADPAIYPETLWHDARVGYGITNRARFHLYSCQHFEGADGHNWQLSKAQRQLLQRYYDANLLVGELFEQ